MAKELTEQFPCAGGCGKTSGKILGRGMCPACYQKTRRAEQKAASDNLDIEPVIITDADFPPVPSEDDFPEDLGNFEKRPGLLSNPSANQDASEEGESDLDGSFADKFRTFFGGKKSQSDNKIKAPITKEQRPKPAGKRVSGADSIGDLWSAVGGLISRNPRHRPSGMLLQWQSAAAGEIIDEAIKGTAFDRMLVQRAVKARGRFDLMGAVFMPPAIVFAIEMNPERAPMLLPMLESSLRNSLPHMVPAVKKARKRQADQAEAIRELFPDAPEGTDPVQELINELFASWYSEPAPQPTPEREYEDESF